MLTARIAAAALLFAGAAALGQPPDGPPVGDPPAQAAEQASPRPDQPGEGQSTDSGGLQADDRDANGAATDSAGPGPGEEEADEGRRTGPSASVDSAEDVSGITFGGNVPSWVLGRWCIPNDNSGNSVYTFSSGGYVREAYYTIRGAWSVESISPSEVRLALWRRQGWVRDGTMTFRPPNTDGYHRSTVPTMNDNWHHC